MCAMMPMFRQRSSGKVRATEDLANGCAPKAHAVPDWMKDCLEKSASKLPKAAAVYRRGSAVSRKPDTCPLVRPTRGGEPSVVRFAKACPRLPAIVREGL